MHKRTALLLGSLGVSTVTVALLVAFVPFPKTTPLDGVHFSAPAELLADDDILGAEQVRYQSDTFGYTLTYPGTWSLDDRKSISRADVLYGPNKDVVVRINTESLPQDVSTDSLDRIVESMHETFISDATFTLSTLSRLAWRQYPVVRIEGTRTSDTKSWHIVAITLFRIDRGDMLHLLFTVENSKVATYEAQIGHILESLSM